MTAHPLERCAQDDRRILFYIILSCFVIKIQCIVSTMLYNIMLDTIVLYEIVVYCNIIKYIVLYCDFLDYIVIYPPPRFHDWRTKGGFPVYFLLVVFECYFSVFYCRCA